MSKRYEVEVIEKYELKRTYTVYADSAKEARDTGQCDLYDATDGWKSEGAVGTANGIAELVKTVTKKVRRYYWQSEEDY